MEIVDQCVPPVDLFDYDEDQIAVTMVAKSKAKRRKKEANQKKTEQNVFKRKAPKTKSNYGSKTNRKVRVASNMDSHVNNELEPLEEARKTWILGKQIGLYAENEDEVVEALAKGIEDVNHVSKHRKRKKHKRKNKGG